jgi:hypothetical protein
MDLTDPVAIIEFQPHQLAVLDLSGGKEPDHFANQEDLKKAIELEQRLLNLLSRARSISHSLSKVYAGAVPSPSRWSKTQETVKELDKAVTEAHYQARRAKGVRLGHLGS